MIKYPCNSCKTPHRRGALVLIRKELLCRKCMLIEYPTLNLKKIEHKPSKAPKKLSKDEATTQ